MLRRHAPEPAGRRLHDAADIALPFGDDVDKGLAVERQRHRPPQIGIVERRLVAVDQQVAVDAAVGVSSQIACGTWFLISFSSGIVS